MDNLKNDHYFVDSMVLDASFIIEHTKNVSYEAFCQNPVLMDSVCFRFIQISESGKRVSDDFKQTHKNVPWPLINGLRNRLVHTYGEVDPRTIYQTATEDLPDLVRSLKESKE